MGSKIIRAVAWIPGAALMGPAGPLAAGCPRAEGPLPGHTGGFGEPTCSACHQGPGPTGASVRILGLPAAWTPATEYRFDVVVQGDAIRRGGFQLSARFADGPGAGAQAGSLAPTGTRVHATAGAHIEYIHHTYEGTAASSPGSVRWTLQWTSPAHGVGAIAFHVSGNASNDDNSEFGDAIVAASDTVPAASTVSVPGARAPLRP
jgi:hypothetical protein